MPHTIATDSAQSRMSEITLVTPLYSEIGPAAGQAERLSARHGVGSPQRNKVARKPVIPVARMILETAAVVIRTLS